jgi:hypothetical protein
MVGSVNFNMGKNIENMLVRSDGKWRRTRVHTLGGSKTRNLHVVRN